MYRFMEEVDGYYQQYAEGSVQELLLSFPDVFATKYIRKKKDRSAIVDELKATIMNSFQDIGKRSEAYRRNRFVNLIINAVRILPKEELARLAELLVQLTSLKRRMSMELETVGEPIDVAVISKGDGFVGLNGSIISMRILIQGFLRDIINPRTRQWRMGMPKQVRERRAIPKTANLARLMRRKDAETQLNLFVDPHLEGKRDGEEIVEKIKRELEVKDKEKPTRKRTGSGKPH